MSTVELTATELRCEYLRDPMGIDVKRPRLSWMLKSDGQGEVQIAYQVIVSRSEEALASGEGDLWDSGKVESDQSIHVPYAGKELASETRCYWNVRVWGKDGQPSPWSKTARWTMGLLKPGDWKGKWIAGRAALDPSETLSDEITKRDEQSGELITQKEPSPIFRKTFDVAKPIERATAYICGLGLHELRINGSKVGDAVLQPDFTRYDKRVQYITHDVTGCLKQGANAIGVILGNGFYNSHSRDAWAFDRTPWRNTPRLLMQVSIEYADGTSETIATDATWKTSTGPIVFDGMRNGETYDARLEKPAWDTTDCSDADWRAALVVDGPTGALQAKMTLPIRLVETLTPVKVTEPKPGVFVLDMGQSISGWARLKVSGPAGTVVKIRYDEHLTAEGLIDERNASLVFSDKFQTDTYILKGEGVETWEPRFVYHGFQYAQIEGFPGTPAAESLIGCVVHTDFESHGSFECSNDLLNSIQRCTRWSYVGNFVGIPTDCPHREKNGWTGDAHLASEAGIYNFNPAANYTKWMNDFDDIQNDDGDMTGIVPSGGWGYGIGPSWDSAYFLIPHYMRLYEGDPQVLTSHYEGYKRYIEFLTRRAEGHIVNYGLGDWCPPEGGAQGHKTPESLTSTAYYYIDALIVSEVAAALGKNDEAAHYAELAEAIKKAFVAKFYNPETGKFTGDEQTGMATALYQGLVPEGEKAKVLAALVADVEARDGHVWCGILGTKYILHALADNGRVDVAYRIVTQRTFPSWGHFVEQGATTLWETWDGEASRNHIMFGDISAWFYETLAGINPDPALPGFKHIIIRPRPAGDLKWVRAEHISPYGQVKSAWKLDGGKFTLNIEIPANTTATVYLPSGSTETVGSGKHEFVE